MRTDKTVMDRKAKSNIMDHILRGRQEWLLPSKHKQIINFKLESEPESRHYQFCLDSNSIGIYE